MRKDVDLAVALVAVESRADLLAPLRDRLQEALERNLKEHLERFWAEHGLGVV